MDNGFPEQGVQHGLPGPGFPGYASSEVVRTGQSVGTKFWQRWWLGLALAVGVGLFGQIFIGSVGPSADVTFWTLFAAWVALTVWGLRTVTEPWKRFAFWWALVVMAMVVLFVLQFAHGSSVGADEWIRNTGLVMLMGGAVMLVLRSRRARPVCPFCAESVKPAAIVCRHCGRDLPNATTPA